MANSSRVTTLQAWSSDNDICIEPSIKLKEHATMGIHIVSSQSIDAGVTVASIPKSSILSVRSCSSADRIPFVPYGHDAHLALSLALYSELLKGDASRWHGYLQSLPSDPVPIALLWDVEEVESPDEDGKEGRAWLTGTEVDKEICGEYGLNLMDEIRRYCTSTALPLLSELGISSTLRGFLHAYSLVSSRAFLVDAYHGLSMVPVADAFNHIVENHVHLESDFDVCPACGSLSECPHDRDDIPTLGSTSHSSDQSSKNSELLGIPSPDTCDMVTNRPVPPGTEVFNTYGSHLSNAALLTRYGFTLEGNENDIISFDLSEIDLLIDDGLMPSFPIQNATFQHMYLHLVKSWTRSKTSLVEEGSTLVYRPFPGESQNEEGKTRFAGSQSLLHINSDAQITTYLWLYAGLRSIYTLWGDIVEGRQPTEGFQPRPEDVDDIVSLLGDVMEEQVLLESSVDSDGDDTDEKEGPVEGGKSTSQLVLTQIKHIISILCTRRISRLGKNPDLSAADLGELLDNLPGDRPKTRLALTHVISERSILESCKLAWCELGG